MREMREVLLTGHFKYRNQEDDVLVVSLQLPNSDCTCSTMRDLIAIDVYASQRLAHRIRNSGLEISIPLITEVRNGFADLIESGIGEPVESAINESANMILCSRP